MDAQVGRVAAGVRSNVSGDGAVRLRVLSYNIQTGLASERYRHYLTRSWRHILPHPERWHNLDAIARSIATFDLVGLQEVDPGSLRTGFVNQTQYLADRARFPFWVHQVTRRIGHLTQHSNGLLSRVRVQSVSDLKLPGLPGRGALVARLGTEPESLTVFILHLALGRRARLRQMAFLADEVAARAHAIVMGDLNCDLESVELRLLLDNAPLRPAAEPPRTFPSWRPRWQIDHILVTPELVPVRAYAPPWPFSDHLPIAMEVRLPAGVGVLGHPTALDPS